MFKPNGDLHSVAGRLLKDPWMPPEFITENLNRSVPTASYLHAYLTHNPKAPSWTWDREIEKWGFQCDLYCARAALDVETDGTSHVEVTQIARDVKRELTYQRHGLRILRFDNALVNCDPQRVYDVIFKVYTGRCATKNLTVSTPSRLTNLTRILERARAVYYGSERRELADAIRAELKGLFAKSPDLQHFLAGLER